MAGLWVYDRAILTEFSTASDPELNKADRFSPRTGVNRFSCSQTATYCSYGVTMKQVWVKSAAWAATASTTRGDELPIVVTAMPEPRSMSRLPSTSSTMPPPARAAYTGMVVPTPRETAADFRPINAADFGPGMVVARWRDCSGWLNTASSILHGRRRQQRVSSLAAGTVCRRRMRWWWSAAVSWPRSP
ncbi:hypothetical protein BN970_07048 [Mycolicibacterium conceptionense]|uniref:Uncharacterized protein n=1 Tax=Mycolicibacterium conceptionense TaxID=451644 RepID=A0A0U1E1Y4_9MYCO|nr:hypothetical protein BN970_07048 [Mycolicibacterium conceptionense]